MRCMKNGSWKLSGGVLSFNNSSGPSFLLTGLEQEDHAKTQRPAKVFNKQLSVSRKGLENRGAEGR